MGTKLPRDGESAAHVPCCADTTEASRSEAAEKVKAFRPWKRQIESRGPSGPETFGDRVGFECGVLRGPGKVLSAWAEVSTDRVFMNVRAMGFVGLRVLHPELFEAIFPDRKFRLKAEGKTSFDELHRFFDGDVGCGREDHVDVVGHEDEGVQLIAAFGAVVVEEMEKKVGVRVGLEKAAAIRGDGGDEEGAEFGRVGSGHEVRLTDAWRAG